MKTLKNFNLCIAGVAIIAQMVALVMVLLSGCSDDSIGPCYDHEVQCQILKSKMDNAKTEAERNQYKQFYLAEKQLLDNCQKQ